MDSDQVKSYTKINTGCIDIVKFKKGFITEEGVYVNREENIAR